MASTDLQHTHARGFEHEALLYAGEDEFVERTAAFVREGVAAGEPALVMVGRAKIERLREALGPDAGRVRFADMEQAGRNPARIIPAWREFATAGAKPGRGMRGVGEPIWAARSPAELVECQTHESLLNAAFADAESFRLLCPYDTTALPPPVIDEARRSHPIVTDGDVQWSSATYRADEAAAAGLDKPLPAAPADARELAFDVQTLDRARELVASEAAAAGLSRTRANGLALAMTEAGANSIRHGGGSGRVRVWREPGKLVCEVRDAGRILDPLVGRVEPPPGPQGGHGLWLANRLCDLVQIRSFRDGAVVRLHVRA